MPGRVVCQVSSLLFRDCQPEEKRSSRKGFEACHPGEAGQVIRQKPGSEAEENRKKNNPGKSGVVFAVARTPPQGWMEKPTTNQPCEADYSTGVRKSQPPRLYEKQHGCQPCCSTIGSGLMPVLEYKRRGVGCGVTGGAAAGGGGAQPLFTALRSPEPLRAAGRGGAGEKLPTSTAEVSPGGLPEFP